MGNKLSRRARSPDLYARADRSDGYARDHLYHYGTGFTDVDRRIEDSRAQDRRYETPGMFSVILIYACEMLTS